jgi:hypothetical protein
VNIADPVAVLRHLFLGGALACADAGDADDSGTLNITDPVYLLDFLFRRGERPPAPFPGPGVDPSGDDLGCM